jgi:hypothetical protein
LSQIKSIGDYLGKSLSDAQLKQIVEFTRFNNLKETAEKKMLEVNQKAGYFGEKMVFFRKGEIGDWRNYFSDEQAKRFDEFISKTLKYKGLLKDTPTENN